MVMPTLPPMTNAETITFAAERPDWQLWLTLALLAFVLWHSIAWCVEAHAHERNTRR